MEMNDDMIEVKCKTKEELDLVVDYFKNLSRYFKKKNGMSFSILPCEGIEEATKGYMMVQQWKEDKVVKEKMIWFQWQFAEPIKDKVVVEDKKTKATLKICFADSNFVKADDPQRRMMGFINYKKSIWYLFPIVNLMTLPEDLKEKIREARKEEADLVGIL